MAEPPGNHVYGPYTTGSGGSGGSPLTHKLRSRALMPTYRRGSPWGFDDFSQLHRSIFVTS